MKSQLQRMQRIAEAIDWPLRKWPGNCYGVACAILKANLVKGKARYGYYHGFIHEDSVFGGRDFTHHGWIEQGETIYDPTRWAFEMAEPYIWIGPKDDPDYDLGGNRVREAFMPEPPPFVDTQTNWPVPKHILPFARLMLEDEIESGVLCAQQIGWLASLPLQLMNDMAKPVFTWVVEEVGLPGFIPQDNRELILGGN